MFVFRGQMVPLKSVWYLVRAHKVLCSLSIKEAVGIPVIY